MRATAAELAEDLLASYGPLIPVTLSATQVAGSQVWAVVSVITAGAEFQEVRDLWHHWWVGGETLSRFEMERVYADLGVRRGSGWHEHCRHTIEGITLIDWRAQGWLR